jgi:hypothetical protein
VTLAVVIYFVSVWEIQIENSLHVLFLDLCIYICKNVVGCMVLWVIYKTSCSKVGNIFRFPIQKQADCLMQ